MAGKRIDLKTVKSARGTRAEASEREADLLPPPPAFSAPWASRRPDGEIARAARPPSGHSSSISQQGGAFGRATTALMNVTIEAGFSETEALFAQGAPPSRVAGRAVAHPLRADARHHT